MTERVLTRTPSVLAGLIRPVVTIAFNTYREAVRSKVLYSILFFAVFLIGFAAILGELSLTESVRVIGDMGLFSLSLFGNMMAIFLGSSFVYKEIQRKSIFTILSKPIRRWQYFVGKFAGITATLYLQLTFMMLVLMVTFWTLGEGLPAGMLTGFWLICVEVTLMTTVALLFSSFSTPYTSGFLSLGVLVAGKTSDLLLNFAAQLEGGPLPVLLTQLERVIPALHIFNVSRQVTYGEAIPGQFVFHASAYGFCYAALLLVFGALIFWRRDFV